MVYTSYFSFISFISCCAYTNAFCPITFQCNDTSLEQGPVEKYCKQAGAEMIDQCCFLNITIIGLDLRNCGIKILNLTNSNFTELVVMDLQNNDLETISKAEFVGLKNLENLFLPKDIPCPGGDAAWNKTHTIDNKTECDGQLDPCLYLNISCTVNGLCEHIGPGSMKCVCQPNHFGYKCLNEGIFPTTVFCISLIIPTIVLSVVLWFIIGREPYRKLLNYQS